MWFETLTGFSETSPLQVRENIILDGERLKSLVNGKIMTCGRLQTPSLAELRERVRASKLQVGKKNIINRSSRQCSKFTYR